MHAYMLCMHMCHWRLTAKPFSFHFPTSMTTVSTNVQYVYTTHSWANMWCAYLVHKSERIKLQSILGN